jgi:bifunctional non-homologous end joining protein LigD
MSLAKYKQKRTFTKTPEPQGGKSSEKQLRFVIQKHAASHLHYDFRLEMEGVLKSWAVPKGPSTDPEVKRLAMMVEDHPYDYRTFEGLIPKGQYGGGTVIVWDEGTYEAADMEGGDKDAQEKSLLHQLHSGKIKFTMHGKKLKGAYALVKTHGREENAWLLMKAGDKYAAKTDITEKDKSVVSRKTIEQIAATSDNIYGMPAGKKKLAAGAKEAAAKKGGKAAAAPRAKSHSRAKAIATKAAPQQKADTEPGHQEDIARDAAAYLKQAPKGACPKEVSPMLCTLVDKPFDKEGWLFEVKWDGYRAVGIKNKSATDLQSRNNKSFTEKFYPVYNALKKWGINAVVDGEIVVLNDKGEPSFGALQNWRSEADGNLFYYVFDILWLEGKDLTGLPLTERIAILKAYIPHDDTIRLSEGFDANGLEFFETAKKLGLEGIVAKQKNSTYHMADRTKDWLKIKSNKRQEVVIGGYTQNEGSPKAFSALLAGVYDKGKLHYIGKIGTGFNTAQQQQMMKLFTPMITKACPCADEPDVNQPSRFRHDRPHATATWLRPQLLCEVSYAEMTSDGVMRHPSFEGMRMDKKASEVVLEKEKHTTQVVKTDTKKPKAMATPGKTEEGEANKVKGMTADKSKGAALEKKVIMPVSSTRKTLLNPSEETQVKKINGHELKFTNLGKEYWPEDGLTKRDMINYYYQIAPYILPYLKDRPQSLNRFPNGIHGENFYQKDVTGKAPDWAETFLYHSDADERDKHFLVCTDEASLLFMASLGCIELNPWSSRVKTPDHPDFCIIDLDPDQNTFDQVIQAAQITKKILDGMGVPSCCKTSGSTGLHIYIPLGAKYTYDQSKEFARVVATLVQQEIPDFSTLTRKTSDRNGKMYIDFLQNRPQATIAAAYSVRPKPGATVSTPLHWDEVKKGLKMQDFTIKNVVERVKREGDLFKPVLGKGIDMLKAISK